MKRTVCKPRVETEETRRQLKCYGEKYKVSTNNNAKKQNSSLQKDKPKTTWLHNPGEKIGIQNKHIDDLGINIRNYMKPRYVNVRKDQRKSCPVEQIIPSAAAFERIISQNLYQVLKMDVPKMSVKDVMQQLPPLSASRVLRKISQKIRPSSKVFKLYKLEKLLSNEHVRKISCRELKDRTRRHKFKGTLRPSRIVKHLKRSKNVMADPKQNWHKNRSRPESKAIVHWIRIEKQRPSCLSLAQLSSQFIFGSCISFDLIQLKSNRFLLKESPRPKTRQNSTTNIKLRFFKFLLILCLSIITQNFF